MRSEPVYRRRRAVALLVVGGLLTGIGWLSLGRGAPTSAARQPGDPQRLVVSSLKIDASVVPITMGADLTLAPPRDPKEVGWWQEGPRPGDPAGTAVLTGHSVHDGGGVLDDLEALRPGDRLEVSGDQGRLEYEVRRIEIVDQETLAALSADLFQPDGPSRLALVTCENWNGRSYDANVVVLATPLT